MDSSGNRRNTQLTPRHTGVDNGEDQEHSSKATCKTRDAVVNVYINHEKKFTYVEMRFVEEASNAMALDGIIFEGTQVIKVRRPTGYKPSLAATLGPSQPNPNLNLAAAGVLYPGSTGDGLEGRDYIFVGGLPYYFH
ncbi:hypothetical protein FXO37_04285 [Capsicum annuum]|nr:hypothetical protein FXO37_04285 [Capsicum annuum]